MRRSTANDLVYSMVGEPISLVNSLANLAFHGAGELQSGGVLPVMKRYLLISDDLEVGDSG